MAQPTSPDGDSAVLLPDWVVPLEGIEEAEQAQSDVGDAFLSQWVSEQHEATDAVAGMQALLEAVQRGEPDHDDVDNVDDVYCVHWKEPVVLDIPACEMSMTRTTLGTVFRVWSTLDILCATAYQEAIAALRREVGSHLMPAMTHGDLRWAFHARMLSMVHMPPLDHPMPDELQRDGYDVTFSPSRGECMVRGNELQVQMLVYGISVLQTQGLAFAHGRVVLSTTP
jgi:hypothetical protein